MPGDEWQKFANLRLLYTYMYTHPGAKLLFMGNEFAQTSEWNFNTELDWHLLVHEPHEKMQHFVSELNKLYTTQPELYEYQFDERGFEWIDLNHRNECVIVYMRKGKKNKENLLMVFNMTPVKRENWKINVHGKKEWEIIFNSDNKKFWGSSEFDHQIITTTLVDKKNKLYEINLHLPSLGVLVLK
jgi:1,4-alpha-glucan branching enzyme